MELRYWAILLAMGAAFGGSFAFNEILLNHFAPMSISALRLTIGALGCWVFVVISGRRAGIGAADIQVLILLGVFQYAAPFSILPLAQMHVTASAAGIANALTPVATVLVTHLWPGGERANTARMLGVLLAASGIPVIMAGAGTSGGSDPRYVAFAILAPFCYAVALNIVRGQALRDPLLLTTWAMTFGAAMVWPVTLGIDGVPPMPGLPVIGALLFLGLGLTTVTFITMTMIIPRVGPINMSLVTIFAPVFAVIFGRMLFDDAFGPMHVAGAAMILTAIVVIDGRVLRALSRRGRASSGRAA